MENDKIKEKRNIGLDVLRILAMIMIVVLHYLGKGELLKEENTDYLNHVIYWFFECLCIIAVNCYVLISGYFLVKSDFKMKKFLNLWGQVVFYSATVYIITILLGLKEFNIKEAIKSFMPVLTNQYWFVNTYLVMYLLSPFINKMVLNLNKDEYKKLIIILLIIFSILTILPSEMLLDKTGGMGIIWFVCLYIIAAYIRLHMNEIKNKKYLLLYFLLAILLTVIILSIQYICKKIGIEDKSGKFLQYNNIIIAFESIFLFLYFKGLEIKKEKIIRLVKKIAPLTFAVYIIHEQPTFRTVLYTKILHVDMCYHNPYGIVIVFGSTILIFTVCILIEYIRKKVTNFINEKLLKRKG